MSGTSIARERTVTGGVIPPLITPLRPDGTLDVESLGKLVERSISAGVAGVFVLGSTGDVSYLSDAERSDVARAAVAASAGRVPVLAGAIDVSAIRVRDQARRLVELGVDGVVAIGPLYGLNDESEVRRHFEIVSSGLPVPVIAYDIPVRGPQKLSPGLLVELALDGSVEAVKDSSTDVTGLRHLVALNAERGHPLAIFSGLEVFGDAAATLGVDGVVPGLSNVDPEGHVRVWQLAAEGRFGELRELQSRLVRLYDIVRQAPGRSRDVAGSGAFKVALEAMGVIASATVPPPLAPLDDAATERIVGLVREFGPQER